MLFYLFIFFNPVGSEQDLKGTKGVFSGLLCLTMKMTYCADFEHFVYFIIFTYVFIYFIQWVLSTFQQKCIFSVKCRMGFAYPVERKPPVACLMLHALQALATSFSQNDT